MKSIYAFILSAMAFSACMNNDKAKTAEVKDVQKKAMEDTAHYTNIAWLDSTYKDLGKVKAGQQVEVSYRFKNTGNSNLVIASVTASCGCTTPDKPEKPIPPGEEGIIKAVFDSKGRPVGVADKDIYVIANTMPSQTHQLVFKVEITN